MLFLNILLFIFIIGFLIFIHEFFHFLAAKKAKVKVEEFCLGFPPRIFKKKIGETLYSLGVIPFGGFVKLFGEDKEQSGEGAFYQKKFLQKSQVILAGVVSNFLLAIVLFAIVYAAGYPEPVEGKIPKNAKNVNIQIISVQKDSPAEKSGFFIGDKIIRMRLGTKSIIVPKEIKDVQNFTKLNQGKSIFITVKRGANKLTKSVKLRSSTNGRYLGVELAKTAVIQYPWYRAIFLGFKSVVEMTKLSLQGLFLVIKNAILGVKTTGLELTGIVGIGGLFTQIANLGFVFVIRFTAFLSLNLAIVNALPFPALDGGRFLFLLIEKVRRREISANVENAINGVGLVILVILMILVTIKDIRNLL
jgi:regulator of sigma E protease